MITDPFIILGLDSTDVTDKEVSEKARSLIKSCHPDTFSRDMDSTERERLTRRFQEIKEAWDRIKTVERREAWLNGFDGGNALPHLQEIISDFTSIFFDLMNEQTSDASGLAQALGHSSDRDILKRMKKVYRDKIKEAENNVTRLKKIHKQSKKQLPRIKCKASNDVFTNEIEKQLSMMLESIAQQEAIAKIHQWKIDFLERNYDWEMPEEGKSTSRRSTFRITTVGNWP